MLLPKTTLEEGEAIKVRGGTKDDRPQKKRDESNVAFLMHLQAIGGIHSQTGDGLRRLTTNPHQLDHEVYLVTGGLLQRGTAHSAGGERWRQSLLRKQRRSCAKKNNNNNNTNKNSFSDRRMASCGAAAGARQFLAYDVAQVVENARSAGRVWARVLEARKARLLSG